MSKIKLLLVDDHAVVRRGLRGFLELIEDFEEERSMDTPTPSQLAALQEQKVRKLIRKTIRQ